MLLLSRLALKLGALDDRFAVLKHLVCDRSYEVRRQAKQSHIHWFDVAPMSKYWLSGPVVRKCLRYAFSTAHDTCELDVIACEDSLCTGSTEAAETEHSGVLPPHRLGLWNRMVGDRRVAANDWSADGRVSGARRARGKLRATLFTSWGLPQSNRMLSVDQHL